jgi:hypothetical protein
VSSLSRAEAPDEVLNGATVLQQCARPAAESVRQEARGVYVEQRRALPKRKACAVVSACQQLQEHAGQA